MTHKQPESEMLCRVEFDCPDMGLMVVDFTLKFENETQYVGLDKDDFAMVVEKKEFIAWHAIDERSELDIAKEKQVKSAVQDIHSCMFELSDETATDLIMMLQHRGHLEEIILPLKAKYSLDNTPDIQANKKFTFKI